MEILFPVEQEDIKAEVMHILNVQLEDTLKAHILNKDGKYERVDRRGKTPMASQLYFCEEAVQRAAKTETPANSRVFVPAEPLE